MASSLEDLRCRLENLLTHDFRKCGLRELPGHYFFFDDILRLEAFRDCSAQQLHNAVHGDEKLRFSARGSKVRLKPAERNRDPDIHLSKKMAWLLRHGAESVGLQLSEGGYLHIDEILQLPQFASFCYNDIRRIVLNDKKGRYQFRLSSSSRPQVRATQGHSVEVENMGLREIHDPSAYPTVVHGTYFKNWASIRRQGLSRMSRTHIHFARGDPGANDVISGMRASAEVMIYIDLALAMRDGFKFFLSDNGVVLCPGDHRGFIPPKYFKEVFQRRPHLRLSLQEK